jgi:uncharacterized protein YkwD
MLVTMPILGGANTDLAGLFAASPSSSAPVITAADARSVDDDSTVAILEYVERRTAESDSAGPADDRDTEHSAQAPADTTTVARTGAGASSGSTVGSGADAPSGSSAGSSSGSTGGSSGGSSAPAPSAPAPAPQPEAPKCPGAIGGSTPGAPGKTSAGGVGGTTSSDLQSFAEKFNAIRVANCLPPVPFSNIRYDSCMEQRLFWMAEDPSTDPMSAWGHIGSQRSDGVPSVGCDGNLAGGSGNTGATVAQKWWDSSGHRASLYKPTYTGGTGGVCILFAMTHGGVPNEPASFTRAAARWTSC